MGKRASTLGNRSLEKKASLMAEAAMEFYDDVLSNEDRQIFVEQRPDGSNFDERWNFVEWPLPLLAEISSDQFPNPKNYAQRQIIGELIAQQSPPPAAEQSSVDRTALIALAKRLNR